MEDLEKLAKLVRYYCLLTTSTANSGHLTSSLSATDLMVTLMFGGFFKYDLKNPDFPNNDRLIFSKGHASSLFYGLWAAAGQLSENDLLSYRKFGSQLEGHPSMEFKYTEAPTGSLGQGLSIGIGMALAAKMDKLSYKTFVLLGDGEMAEGQIWEAIEVASHYNLNNLIGIIDVNRLGQSGETMLGWDVKTYQKRLAAFGWETIVVDGHNLNEISHAFAFATSSHKSPTMIIAKTIKGKGIKTMENKEGFHAKVLPYEKMGEIIESFGEFDKNIRGVVAKPGPVNEEIYSTSRRQVSHVAERRFYNAKSVAESQPVLIASRTGFGESLASLASEYPSLVSLDGEVSNSTYSEIFAKKYPDRFFEMFIAEQNMASVAVGLARRGKLPFVSTFAAFWTRAHDQIRMAAYAKANVKFVGSHAGVSIGADGFSQMGLEDIAMFRSVFGSVVLYPSDGVSAQKLTEKAAEHKGLVYLRTTRAETPVIYSEKEKFEIGGSKILRSSSNDVVCVIGAGITLHEALKAHEMLQKENISVRVLDLYSIKPIDSATLEKIAVEVPIILVVEDHYAEGGIAEAVQSCLRTSVNSLAVTKMPRSGKPEELMAFEQIDAAAIAAKVQELII
jgi:transketolase